MLRRAKRLQSTFDEFCSQYDQDHFALSQEEWRQIDYLLWITLPFFKFTTLLSKTKDVSIHLIFSIYNKLFTHLETSKSALKRKKVAWKQLMLASLEAAEKKLSHYYGMTDTIDNNLYAIGTSLSPQQKLQFFEGKDWDDPDNDWRAIYRASLEDYFQTYKQRHSDAQSTSKVQASAVIVSELEAECGVEESQPLQSGEHDELKEYLDSGKLIITFSWLILILLLGIIRTLTWVFWKDHQHQFPALANLARDVLSIPATGAGVERLFNSARDICHYRRGSLKPSTIQDLMMFMCTSRFEIEEGEQALINEYLTHEEIQANQEEKDISTQHLEPISDNEEGEEEIEGEITVVLDTIQPSVDRAQSLRRQRALSELDDKEDRDEGEPSLPNTQNRHSGRVRKRSRLLEGYETP